MGGWFLFFFSSLPRFDLLVARDEKTRRDVYGNFISRLPMRASYARVRYWHVDTGTTVKYDAGSSKKRRVYACTLFFREFIFYLCPLSFRFRFSFPFHPSAPLNFDRNLRSPCDSRKDPVTPLSRVFDRDNWNRSKAAGLLRARP